MKSRGICAITALAVVAGTLTACTPTTVVAGSEVTVAVATPFTSANASTSFGRSSPTNADVAYLTGTGFGYYDDRYALVDDASFACAHLTLVRWKHTSKLVRARVIARPVNA